LYQCRIHLYRLQRHQPLHRREVRRPPTRLYRDWTSLLRWCLRKRWRIAPAMLEWMDVLLHRIVVFTPI
jgi:hypothetical protein